MTNNYLKKYYKIFYSKLVRLYNCTIGNVLYGITVSWESSKFAFLFRVIFQLVLVGISLLSAYFSKLVIDALSITNTDSKVEQLIINFAILLLVMFAFQVSTSIIVKINDIVTELHQDILKNFLNIRLINKISKLDISFFDSPKFYNDYKNVKNDQDVLENLTWTTFNIFKSLALVITSIPILISLNLKFTIFIVILSIPSVFAERYFNMKMYLWSRSKAQDERKINYYERILTEKSFAKDIRLFCLFETMLGSYKSYWKKWIDEKISLNIRKAIFTVSISILPYFASFGLMYLLGINIINKKMTIGDYTFFSSIAGNVTNGLSSIISSFVNIYDSNIRITNLNNFMNIKPILEESGNIKPAGELDIEFRNVSFIYPNTEEYVLRNINLKIRHGEKVTLVGLNGSGKTTIINLILRFYDPTEGHIFLGGIDIKEYDLTSFRNYFSAVFQDLVNYSFTARMNIALSQIDQIDNTDSIMNTCMITGAINLIEKLQNGLDSYLTKQFDVNGEELSGGEWQKIAITRAFFRKSSTIILDEPSSSLDAEAEYNIFKLFDEITRNKTVICISHRLSNVTMCDKVYLIEQGQIIESGSPKELIELNGKFAYLFNLQAGRYTVL